MLFRQDPPHAEAGRVRPEPRHHHQRSGRADPSARAPAKFIDRYMFPNGEVPHVSLAIRAMSEQNLEVIDVESLRFHYAKTLGLWASRLEAAQARRREGSWANGVTAPGSSISAGCAHAFARGWISLHQIVAAKATRKSMKPLQWTREHQCGTAFQASNGRGTA